MKNSCLIIAGSICMLVICNCGTPQDNWKNLNDVFFIPEDRLEETMKKSNEGDGQASWKLFQHYTLAVIDYREAIPWLIKAHEQHYPKATSKVVEVYSKKFPCYFSEGKNEPASQSKQRQRCQANNAR